MTLFSKGGGRLDNINDRAIAAASDESIMEELIDSSRDFILSCAGRHSGRYISTSDDEYSIALYAFYEAVRSYDTANGDFLPFAGMVIKRRLTDYYRRQSRYSSEHLSAPEVFSGDIDDESSDVIQYEVQAKLSEKTEPSAEDEISAVTGEFAQFGFTFMDLADCSPKSVKTKSQCKDAVGCILQSPLLLSEMMKNHMLPVKAVSSQSGVNRKTIERHRKYIIAAVIILTGDYPMLAEYMKFMKKGGSA